MCLEAFGFPDPNMPSARYRYMRAEVQDGAGLRECRGSCRKKSQLSKSSSDEDDCVIGRSVQSYPRSREKQSFPDQTGHWQTTCLRRGGPIARLRNFVRALVGSRAPNTSSASPDRHARITVMDCCDSRHESRPIAVSHQVLSAQAPRWNQPTDIEACDRARAVSLKRFR